MFCGFKRQLINQLIHSSSSFLLRLQGWCCTDCKNWLGTNVDSKMLINKRFQKMHSKILQSVLNAGSIFRINVCGFLKSCLWKDCWYHCLSICKIISFMLFCSNSSYVIIMENTTKGSLQEFFFAFILYWKFCNGSELID